MKDNYDYLWLLGFCLFAIVAKLLFLGNQINTGIPLNNTLDFSWMSDNIERFLHGYIAGKDFIFTYGPLFQLLYALPAILFHQHSYIAVLYAPIFLTIFVCIFIFFIIKLITHDKKDTVILSALLIFVVDLLSYDTNILFRILFPFLYSLLIYRFISIKKIYLKRICILILPAVFGMYTFDLFILGLIITTLFFSYEFLSIYLKKIRKYKVKKLSLNACIQIFFILFSGILLSIALTKNLNYLFYSYDTVKNYQLVMNIPWTINKSSLLLFFPLAAILLTIYCIKKTNLNLDLKKCLAILTAVSLLQMKSAFIRADEGHIVMGLYPSIIAVFILLYYILREKLRLSFILIGVFFYFLIPYKENYYQFISIKNSTAALALMIENKPFSSIYLLPKDYYFTQKDFDYLSLLIKNNPHEVLVYPYDSYLLNIYGSTYNTLALQFYQYSNSLVEKKTVERLQKSPPEFIILGIDDKSAISLDDIPNFSRNPLLAKWMLQNYIVHKNMTNYLILRFNPNKKIQVRDMTCTVYELDTHSFLKNNFLESLTKPSIYYIKYGKKLLRIPYHPTNKNIFFINRYNDPKQLDKLFTNGTSFDTFQSKQKNVYIVKKYPIPKLHEDKHLTLPIKCY